MGPHYGPTRFPAGPGQTARVEDHRRRYARPEYERRFLLAQLPGDACEPRVVSDRFIRGTRLRLRVVTDRASGEMLQRKAGQKVRPEGDPTSLLHTSLYLDTGEFEVLRKLEADEVVKTRYRWRFEGRPVAVDVYEGPLVGLIVAELAFDDLDELRSFTPSEPLGPEITHVAELTGPNLAHLDPERVAQLLAPAPPT